MKAEMKARKGRSKIWGLNEDERRKIKKKDKRKKDVSWIKTKKQTLQKMSVEVRRGKVVETDNDEWMIKKGKLKKERKKKWVVAEWRRRR